MTPTNNISEKNTKTRPYKTIAGVLLIIIGILCWFLPFSFHYKLAVTFSFLGVVIILMNNEKETHYAISNIQLILIFLILILVFWVLTPDNEYEKFFILIALSIIALKEMLNVFISPYLRKRMTQLIFILFIPLIILFLQELMKIINEYSR